MGKISEALEKSNKGQTLENYDEPVSKSTIEQNEAVHSNDTLESNKPLDQKSTTQTDSEVPDSIDQSLVSILKQDSVEAEQFRLLKNNIMFPEKGEPPKSIMVTSPSPNEGKSFVASNLAASIAQSIDEYVLLMDCDLRRPTIHSIFGVSAETGLSQYLSNEKPLSVLLQKSFMNKLTILPAGPVPKNPSELLSSGQMRKLIHEVSLRYTDRYIIIDTPPPYITSEASAIARQVDGIIIVVRHGKTRKKDVQDIIDIYGKTKILGVVQNFAEKRPGYGYGYYKYGYGYSK